MNRAAVTHFAAHGFAQKLTSFGEEAVIASGGASRSVRVLISPTSETLNPVEGGFDEQGERAVFLAASEPVHIGDRLTIGTEHFIVQAVNPAGYVERRILVRPGR